MMGPGVVREHSIGKPAQAEKGPLGFSVRTSVKHPVNRGKQSWGKCTGKEGLS